MSNDLDPNNGWSKVNWSELGGIVMASMTLGVIHFLYMIRKGRRFRYLDLVLEPSLAIVGGVLVWILTEYDGVPDLIQAVATSLGAWGGPRTIHYLEMKFLGGSRRDDSGDTK